MTRIIIALLAGAAGIALTLTGLGIDAWLHAQDDTLAAREGIFTLSNPGHLLLAAGMALACGGILAALYVAWGMSRARGILGRRWVRVISMQAAGAATAGAVLFALATSASGHEHAPVDGAAAAHTHNEMTQSDTPEVAVADASIGISLDALASAQPTEPRTHIEEVAAPMAATDAPAPPADEVPAQHTHANSMEHDGVTAGSANVEGEEAATHIDGMSSDARTAMPRASATAHHPAPTADELACLVELTAAAKAATIRFEDFSVAAAEGYVTNALDPSRTHHPNRAYKRDGVIFDMAKPESLIYRTDDAGNKRFVGVLYHAPMGQGPAPCGSATFWHAHGQCIDTAGGAPLPELKDKTCPAGYEHRSGNVEMMHLWFVPRGQRS